MNIKLSAMKEKKRVRYNIILNHLREPMTGKQLAMAMGKQTLNCSEEFRALEGEYIICVGFKVDTKNSSSEKVPRRTKIYQAIKFDYNENAAIVTEEVAIVAGARFIAERHPTKLNRKSPKNYVSGSSLSYF